MDMSVIKISSDTPIPIEQHFRVSAGPGAGKTHWLINHIKNVLHQSDRLQNTRKIACITYTNVAVETIIDRLGLSTSQVEVNTIHSFLYRHILKPYLIHIADEYGVNVPKIDRLYDPFVNFGNVRTWIGSHPRKNDLAHPYTENQLTRLPNNIEALNRWLASLRYISDSPNDLKISSKKSDAFYINDNDERRYLNRRCLDILEADFLSYKKLYWQKGVLFHDDVLFFSYQLVNQFPFILQVLRAKFPYFF